MRKKLLTLFAVCMAFVSAANAQTATETEKSKVYFTSDISPESLVKIYNALGKEATGKVAVKISTGESSQSNHLRPELIGQLVKDVKGTLVECNTAYGGNRSNTANHRRAIEERGYGDIATVDIMDEEGYIDIPVSDTKYLQYDRVGSHLANYDFLINLAHFKGHAMGGFGGVLKTRVSVLQPRKVRPLFILPVYIANLDMYSSSLMDRMASLNQWRPLLRLSTTISRGTRFIST